MKVGRVKAYSAAEKAGLKTCDYIWQINGKEVFEMSHNDCVKEVKNASTMLSLNVERYAGGENYYYYVVLEASRFGCGLYDLIINHGTKYGAGVLWLLHQSNHQ